MPRISSFYGVTIWMYFDEGIYQRPHFHARYSGHEASITFDGEIQIGSLPPRAARLVRDWAKLHRVEREANWRRALAGDELQRIAPLP